MTYLQDIEQRGIDQNNRKLTLKMKAAHYAHSEIAELMELSEEEVVYILEEASETAY